MALTVANYMLKPLFPECEIPTLPLKMVAALCITFLTWLNCHSMKVTTKLQNSFMVSKLLALAIVILLGTVAFFKGIISTHVHLF